MPNRKWSDTQRSDPDRSDEYGGPDPERREPHEYPSDRTFDGPYEARYSQPYDRWEPSGYVFYAGEGYHREFVEPFRPPRRGRFEGRGPRDYVRSDERIREEICERLTVDGLLDASGIDVAVEGGEVTLDGSVSDRPSKRYAEDLADSVRGVRQTHNRLRIATVGREIPTSSGPGGEEPAAPGEKDRPGATGHAQKRPSETAERPEVVEPLDSGEASPVHPPQRAH